MGHPTLLAVDDSDADFLLVEMALQECAPDLQLLRATDGEQAVQVLSDTAGVSADNLPDVVLLDINMPKKNGFEVLDFIKTQRALKAIPVVMFSSSLDRRDRNRALSCGADAYITKPRGLDEMLELLHEICLRYLLNPERPDPL